MALPFSQYYQFQAEGRKQPVSNASLKITLSEPSAIRLTYYANGDTGIPFSIYDA